VSAADKIKEVECVFITLERIAQMSQLDCTPMEQAIAVQYSPKRENRVSGRIATNTPKASCMRQARRKRKGTAHRLTHVA
jgi:hypothetical protein